MAGPVKEGSIEIPSAEMEILATYGMEELDRRLRSVTIQGINTLHPYYSSLITLDEIPPSQLKPCALYVLNANFEFQRKLRCALLQKGIDTLHLTRDVAMVDFRWGKLKETISPPVVELSEDDEGCPLVITDGLHRMTLAKESSETSVSAIVIKNTAAPLPVLPTEWVEIKRVDTVPELSQKRKFRFSSDEEMLNWFNGENAARNRERYLGGFPNTFEKLAAAHVYSPGKVPTETQFYKSSETGTLMHELREQYSSAGVLLISSDRKRVCLVQHIGNPGMWSIAAGSKDAQDGSPEETAIRELKEELKISIALSALGNPLVVINKTGSLGKKKVAFLFLLILEDEDLPFETEPFSLSQAKWLPIGEVHEMLKKPSRHIRPRGLFYTKTGLERLLEVENAELPSRFGGIAEVTIS